MLQRLTFAVFLLAITGCASAPEIFPAEHWVVDFGSEHWKIGSKQQNRGVRIIEYVPAGENVEHWNEIVTDQFIVGQFSSATFFLQANLADLRRVVDGFESKVIYDIGTEALYEWWHPDSGKWPAEHQLSLVKYYPTGMMTLSYAKKGAQIDEPLRAKWIHRLKNAKLR